MSLQRERDIRNDIGDRLIATGFFVREQITIAPWNEPRGTMIHLTVQIEGVQTGLTGGKGVSGASARGHAFGFDGPLYGNLLITGEARVTFNNYGPNYDVRDEEMELGLAYLVNAVNGQSLADMTMPSETLVSGWKWQDLTKTQPRLLIATVRYTFMTDDWEAFGTAP